MGSLQDVILRGVRADQPLATDVAIGTLYYVTDESVTERSNGAAWQSYSDAGSGGITQLTGNVTAGPGTGSQVATLANGAVTFAKMQNFATDTILGRDAAGAGVPQELTLVNGLEFTGANNIQTVVFVRKRLITLVVDGAGVAIATGNKGYIRFPFTGTITKVTMLADQAGSAVVDIWKDTYANYPPTVADTITAAAKPTIAASNKSEDSTLTGWTTAVAAGDVFGFNVDSAATITRLVLELEVTVTG